MSSVLKNQILKPLSRFVKNLSPDKIKLSVFRGEGDLTNLELDEDALMELLDLPTWLCIRKVTCNKVAIKIQWTKLKSQPIIVFLDEVHVEVEALEEPRKPKAGNLPSYRLNEGKYGLIDRVLDGMKVIINSVRVYFKALTFRASICLDRLTVASRLPNWGDGDLKYTFVRDTSSDQILLFKEICWETTRLEADGLRDLQLTPVKLITNACRVRITLKKRLSDSAVLSSRVQFVLDELLWVLTVSQLEAAVIFLKSLKKSILKSVEQSKSRAAQASNVSGLKHRPSSLNHSNDSRYQHQADGSSRTMSNAARLFDVYDVSETSYHVSVDRLELHFCEENRPDLVLSNNCVRNGSIRVVFQRVAFEFYPFHLSSHGRGKWRGYEEPNLKRLAWLQETPTFAALERNRTSFGGSQQQLGSGGSRRYLMESAVLLRVSDFEITCVSTMRKRQAEPFASSDKRLWHLSSETNTITLCYTGYYRSDGSVDNVPLPDLYCQLNPLHLRLDFDTMTWLNAFYLNVSKNLHDLAKKFQQSEWSDVIPRMGPASLPASPAGAIPPEPYLKLFFRLEAVQPRLVVPAEFHVSGQPERPHSMQLQASNMIISNVNPDSAGLASALSSHGDALRFYPQQQADVPVQWEDFQAFQSNRIYPVNLIAAAGAPAQQGGAPGVGYASTSAPCFMCCIKCDTVWAEYCGARTPRGTSRPQPFLEEFPLALWFSVRLNTNTEPSNTSSASSASSANTSSSPGVSGTNAQGTPVRPPPPMSGAEVSPSYSLSLLADCGEAPLTLRLHHYQYLYLLRLSDSFLRLMDSLTEDYTFVLDRQPPQHSISLAVHLLQACVLFTLPALSETFTYSASSNQLMRQFMNAAAMAAANETSATNSPPDDGAALDDLVNDSDLLIRQQQLQQQQASAGDAAVNSGSNVNGMPPMFADAPPGVTFPPNPPELASCQDQASPSSRSRSPASHQSRTNPAVAPKSFASAFHRLGSSLNRFGDAVKATVSTSTPHSPAGTDEDGWERLSLGGSEFSDSDEEAKVARLMMQLDPNQQMHAPPPPQAQTYPLQQQMPQQQSVSAGSVWDHQQQLANSMTTAALDAAEAAGADEVDEEAEDVLELESIVSSSVVSASRRDHSTVGFVLRRLHCYGGLAAAGSVLAGHLDAVELRQSGSRGRRAEAEAAAADEAAEAEKETPTPGGEPGLGSATRGGPLMHFRVDIAAVSSQAAAGTAAAAANAGDVPAPSSVWSRVRVLRPWSLSLLMSSVTNLSELLEDELEVPPVPFTCVLEGGLQLVLREDRLCNNLTCPGQHPEVRLALPPGLWLERGRDQTLRLDVRQPLQMQARAATVTVVESGMRMRAPSSPVMSSSSAQTDTSEAAAAAAAASNVGAGGHAPSQELLNLYYTENRKLREKMSRLSRSAAETAAALEEARLELHTMRQERDSLYTTLDCLQAELQAMGPGQLRPARPTMR